MRLDPRRLKRQDVNARFMTAAQMDQLVKNVKQDGDLTSLPLVYWPDKATDAEIEIISGHHRIEAAILAELPSIEVRVIVEAISLERLRALQLSHNALTGQDDMGVLGQMYLSLDLDAKRYSGLTDDVVNPLKNISLAGLNVGAIAYEHIHVFFLPEDAAAVMNAIGELDKAAKKTPTLVAHYQDFSAFFAAVVQVKTKFEVFNSAMAVRLLVDLALQRLEQLKLDEANGDGSQGKVHA